MTIGTTSIMVGVILLILLKLFFRDEADSEKNQRDCGIGQDGLTNIDASDDPGLAHLPGNSYHQSWSAKHTDID